MGVVGTVKQLGLGEESPEAVYTPIAQAPRPFLLMAMTFVVRTPLVATGIMGVLAYLVTHRTREIGLRMALGADSVQVVGLVLRQTFVMSLAGVAIGLAAAAALTQRPTSIRWSPCGRIDATAQGARLMAQGSNPCAVCRVPCAVIRPSSAGALTRR